MSEHIDTFLAITGLEDAQTAANFLEMSGDNLEAAISLFFENGPAFGQSSSQVQTNSTNNQNDYTDADFAQMDMDDDAKMAERLQNEAYSQQQQNEPRAPIQSTTERLVGDVFPGVFGGLGGAFNPLMGGSHGQYRDNDFFSSGTRGVFNQREELDEDGVPKVMEIDDDTDEDDESEEDLSAASATQRRLQRLFRPPFDLIAKLDLDSAKLQAHKNKKWLLVNVQDNSDFQCQCLNRDFWSTYSVKEITRDNFIFLQYASDSTAGQSYTNFYPFESFPHIAILDPMTGERVKQWTSDIPKPEVWVKEVKEFLKQFSLDPSKVNPLVKHSQPKVDINSLTEEQQMEYAISQSLGSKKPDYEEEEEDSELEILNTGNESDPIEIEESDKEDPEPVKKELTEEELIESIVPELNIEPLSGIRIQIRSGSGARVVRKFDADDKVKILYQFVKAHFETGDSFFTLTSQRENIIGKLEMGLKEAGLASAMVLLDIIN